jgi:enoyl-CoA hydratase/carnithine racemase
VTEGLAKGRLPQFYRNIRIERDNELALLQVFRPEVKNALDRQTIDEIEAALHVLNDDASVKGVVFSGFDGALAGADIQGLAKLESPAAARAMCERVIPIGAFVAAMKKPVVAAVDGPVLGGGAEFCMMCHARVVGPSLMLGQPEVNLGVIPGYGGTQRLPRLIGFENAVDLLRTGRPVGAKEACAWGWATSEAAADSVAAAKALLRAHLAGKVTLAAVNEAPLALPADWPPVDLGHHSRAIDAILVDVLRRGLALPLFEGLKVEAEGFGRCKNTVDLDIGLRNFLENGPRTPAQFVHE